jgi:hypothetical protein
LEKSGRKQEEAQQKTGLFSGRDADNYSDIQTHFNGQGTRGMEKVQ